MVNYKDGSHLENDSSKDRTIMTRKNYQKWSIGHHFVAINTFLKGGQLVNDSYRYIDDSNLLITDLAQIFKFQGRGTVISMQVHT